jgi:hypothetical protein
MEQAAVREFAEEMQPSGGAAPRLLGRLSEIYVFASGYRVVPVVGWLEGSPRLIPQPEEVERIIWLELDQLCDPRRWQRLPLKRALRGASGPVAIDLEVPALSVAEEIVWGATAMILAELREVLSGLLRTAVGTVPATPLSPRGSNGSNP